MEGVKKVVLLTGASGFVGRSLLKSLAKTDKYYLRGCARNIDSVECSDAQLIAVGDMDGETQ